MEHTKVNLHIGRKKALLIVVPFSLISVLLCFFASLSLNTSFAGLKALLFSDYEYSATSIELLGKDDYYKFNAGISFTLSAEADKRLNADIIMQTGCSTYTNAVFWNADKLSTFGVAISKGLAVTHDLGIGDSLYSKHTVNGEVCEYIIEQIVPEISSSRVAEQNYLYDGVIIMGYDNRYVDNLSHVVILYTDDPIEELPMRQAATVGSIQYRDDEIVCVCKELAPYMAVFVLLAVLNSVGFVFFFTKEIVHNFKRLIMLGYPNKNLSKAYYGLVCGYGCGSILISTLMSAILLYLNGFLQISMITLFAISVVEFVSLQVIAILFQSRLWRR